VVAPDPGASDEAHLEEAAVLARGEEAVVEGSELAWRVDPDAVGKPFSGRTALLSPFDRLIHDRIRTHHLFDFEYILEMYKPAAARRWGYFALPVLHHDRLIAKVDATAEHAEDVRPKAIDQGGLGGVAPAEIHQAVAAGDEQGPGYRGVAAQRRRTCPECRVCRGFASGRGVRSARSGCLF